MTVSTWHGFGLSQLAHYEMITRSSLGDSRLQGPFPIGMMDKTVPGLASPPYTVLQYYPCEADFAPTGDSGRHATHPGHVMLSNYAPDGLQHNTYYFRPVS